MQALCRLGNLHKAAATAALSRVRQGKPASPPNPSRNAIEHHKAEAVSMNVVEKKQGKHHSKELEAGKKSRICLLGCFPSVPPQRHLLIAVAAAKNEARRLLCLCCLVAPGFHVLPLYKLSLHVLPLRLQVQTFSLRRQLLVPSWVAVKELNQSYCTGETMLITLYAHDGHLI